MNLESRGESLWSLALREALGAIVGSRANWEGWNPSKRQLGRLPGLQTEASLLGILTPGPRPPLLDFLTVVAKLPPPGEYLLSSWGN